MKKVLLTFIIVISIFSLVLIIIKNKPNKTKEKDEYDLYQEKYPNKTRKQVITEVKIGLNKPFYSDSKESKHLYTNYILVNKYNYLKKDYIPKNLITVNKNVSLEKEAAINFNEMVENAKLENLTIIGFSGYRTYEYQEKLYNKYVSIDGRKKADTYSARSGYSEHQTGLAIDVSNNNLSYTEFDQTKEFVWMMKNAYKYGFILRYPKDKENITGYTYEPWHYRYVGLEIASYIKINNITFDEYYVTFIDK